jgi:hypothetical protein
MILFRIKKTGEFFYSNYIDYFNNFVSIGDYRNNKLIKFSEVEKVD